MEKTINQHCVKCGHDDASFEYIPSRIATVVSLCCYSVRNIKEQLKLTCNRCKYQWEVEPLNI